MACLLLNNSEAALGETAFLSITCNWFTIQLRAALYMHSYGADHHMFLKIPVGNDAKYPASDPSFPRDSSYESNFRLQQP